ncbi:hypothetical protein [Streptomyces liangshanensis]|uniref:Uncharacterized protein n=1 Tax=Streptomyces liangshanensis TaxID=2717324 RepID=A0A6G9H678_9ACTN|nr:hypothetical protein [Streptomyces liangshanensis]QIQ06058.1 hypothetical protein HA039_30465 [Streptomyces liangshanensis]
MTTTTEPQRVAFVDHLVPTLPGDEYTVTVTQTVLPPDEPVQQFTAVRRFTVAADPHTLAPELVRAVFPPEGSLGDHSTALPHIALSRPTLPWEHSATDPPPGEGVTPVPWLALLLFASDEQPAPQVVTVTDNGNEERATVIDVPRALLERLLPSAAELPLLAHVRRGGDADTAFVIGNRLPPAGSTSTVHLVSLAGRYRTAAGDSEPAFDFGSGGPDAPVRLVSLASWRFACVDADRSFAPLVRRLSRGWSPFRLPEAATDSAADTLAETFLARGYVPVRHTLRGGGRTVAWYRGPFASGPVAADETPALWSAPVRTADRLLRYHPGLGMFDVSLASAWQLGRLLALQSKDFSTTLYEWKRRRDQAHKRAGTLSAAGADHPLEIAGIDDALPSGAADWLTGLAELRGVPFSYLVPDERLLPVETIRFLGVDQQWVRCLVDGAYSLGRVGTVDAELDASHALPRALPTVTGALIRSDVVSGYPDLEIAGFAESFGGEPLPVLRRETLSRNILLCLFTGTVRRLEVRRRAESLHFGLEPGGGEGTVTKNLRPPGDGDGPELFVPDLTVGEGRVVDVRGLADVMATTLGVDADAFGSGAFARQMIETADRVTFRHADV